jgi:hypothetical protein
MVFGLGRKKNDPAPMQMSPEAMEMLNQLAQAAPSGGAQAPSMAAPSMAAPSMAAPSMASATGAVPASPGTAGLVQFPTVAAHAGSNAEAANTEISAKEQRRLAREEKQAAAIAKREEKHIARRRKRNARARFSRARYLREAQGNAASSVGLAGFFLAVTILVPLIVNSLFLLPATRSNQEIIEEVRSLQAIVDQAQPILQAAIGKKNEREEVLRGQLAGFVADEEATGALRRFVSDLESRGATLKPDTSGTVVNTDVGLDGLTGKNLTLEMKVDFLNYLLVRNRFVRSQSHINVAEESIEAVPGDPIVDVKLVLMVPART